MSYPLPTSLDQSAIRAQHTLMLLAHLREDDVSRAELSRRMGMSRSAISSIVVHLLDLGLVLEQGPGFSSAGRKPTLLSLCSEAVYVWGVDIGARHLGVGLFDLRGHPLEQKSISHDVRQGPRATYAALEGLLEGLHFGALAQRSAGIGVSVAGPVDFRTGRIIDPPNMAGWDGENVVLALEERFGLRVRADNDANLGALAESRGTGSSHSLIYLKCATGIGAGLLLEGRIYRGVMGGAGELGHISINADGPVGRSGNPGSLESYSAGYALLERMRSHLPHLPSTLYQDSSLEDLVHAARQGDPLAVRLVREAGDSLGIALTTLLNLFNPAEVVIGGELAAAGPLLLEAITEVVHSRTLRINRDHTAFRLSTLGANASLLGAAQLALHDLYSPAGLDTLYRIVEQAQCKTLKQAPHKATHKEERVPM